MSASVSVGDECVWLSTGSAEALRGALVRYLRERGEHEAALGARVIVALELMWPADLAADLEPYDDPEVRALLSPAWLALARDVASPHPRLVHEVEWDRLDRPIRIMWVASLLRISRAWAGIDLTDELTSEWSTADRTRLDVWLAETAIERAWARFYGTPSAEHRSELEEALEAQMAVAHHADSDLLTSVHAAHNRMRRRADQHAAGMR